jgi:hypothetical protein
VSYSPDVSRLATFASPLPRRNAKLLIDGSVWLPSSRFVVPKNPKSIDPKVFLGQTGQIRSKCQPKFVAAIRQAKPYRT